MTTAEKHRRGQRTTHRVGATLLAGGFTVNTVTGVWNLWESRSVAQGRALRTVHGISMLVADGLFTYAGQSCRTKQNRARTSDSYTAPSRCRGWGWRR